MKSLAAGKGQSVEALHWIFIMKVKEIVQLAVSDKENTCERVAVFHKLKYFSSSTSTQAHMTFPKPTLFQNPGSCIIYMKSLLQISVFLFFIPIKINQTEVGIIWFKP